MEQSSSVEVWKAIPGYEGFYEVSDQGRVRSVDRMVHNPRGLDRLMRGRVLKRQTSNNGYYTVGLSKLGKPAMHPVHRLVAYTFLGTRPDGHHVRHLDGNPLNNRLENLAYGTPQENEDDKNSYGSVHYNLCLLYTSDAADE